MDIRETSEIRELTVTEIDVVSGGSLADTINMGVAIFVGAATGFGVGMGVGVTRFVNGVAALGK